MSNVPIIFLAFANDRVDHTRYLRNLPIELDGIRKNLHYAQQEGLCEVIERANVTVEQILDIFQNPNYRDRIAVFHYGGHADGYQLLLESLDGSHSVAQGGGLVSFFAKQKGLKLVFFNGCSTQQQAQELVDKGVPAVIGTNNSIQDDIATALSLRFYKNLGGGATIDRSWTEAIDEIRIRVGMETKNLYRIKRNETAPEQLPWNILYKDGAEMVKDWNLPEAVENPLFGLPAIPRRFNLPENPFLFLRRYGRPHAEVFFGRSYFIRELYNRISDPKKAPIILLYGQSGVGKSSLLESGLLPRVEDSHTVRYVRRVRDLGLLGTIYSLMQEVWDIETIENQVFELPKTENLLQTADQLKEISQNLDKELQTEVDKIIKKILEKNQQSHLPNDQNLDIYKKHPSGALSHYWKLLEEKYQKPLIIILDQIEEIYTQANEELSNELDIFLEEIALLFGNPSALPKGKLILSYRKEYTPEIEEGFKNYHIPREKVFLRHLDRKDIVQVVKGITLQEHLRSYYRLRIDENLPVIIADDLLEDKDSAIAPVLQILLTKLWAMVEKEDEPIFTVEKYQKLRNDGILLQDFFYQQINKLKAWNEEVVLSGLALDILNFHTFLGGASDSAKWENLQIRYKHRLDILKNLLTKLTELYLLTNIGLTITGLAHDTLAPLILQQYRESDYAGQRAARIITNKIYDFEDDEEILLDQTDLAIVEKGLAGMRSLSQQEQRLVDLSRKKRKRQLFIRKARRIAAIFAVVIIAFLGIFSGREARKARKEKERTLSALDSILVLQDAVKIKEKEARKERLKAELSAEEANKSAKEALKQGKIAEQKKTEAEAQRNRATEQTLLAEKERNNAQKKTEIATAQEKIAIENLIEARMSGYKTELTKYKTDFDIAKEKAKDWAAQSRAITNDRKRKASLTLDSYQFNQIAHESFQNTLKIFDKKVLAFNDSIKENQKERPYLVQLSESLKNKLLNNSKDFEKVAQKVICPNEIFEALRDAYLSFENDQLSDAENWQISLLANNKFLVNNNEGELAYLEINRQESVYNPTFIPISKQRFSSESFAESNSQIWIGTQDGIVFSFQKNNPKQQQIVARHPNGILAMDYSKNKQSLIYSSAKELYILGKDGSSKKISLNGTACRALKVFEDKEKTWVLVTNSSGELWLLDLDTFSIEKIYQTNLEAIFSIAYYAPKKLVALGGGKGDILIGQLDMKTLAEKKFNFNIRPTRPKGIIKQMVFSQDGNYLAAANFGGIATIWNLDNELASNVRLNEIMIQIQEKTRILSVAFDKNSDYLLFSDEKSLRICPISPETLYQRVSDLRQEANKKK